MKKILEAAVELKTWACLSFTAAVLIYTVCSLAFGERSMDLVMVFELLGLSVGATLLQFVCFSGKVIKKMRYSVRMLVFSIPMFGVAGLCAVLFRWFPIQDPWAWISFAAFYLLGFIGITLGFEIYYWATTACWASIRQEKKGMKREKFEIVCLFRYTI